MINERKSVGPCLLAGNFFRELGIQSLSVYMECVVSYRTKDYEASGMMELGCLSLCLGRQAFAERLHPDSSHRKRPTPSAPPFEGLVLL